VSSLHAIELPLQDRLPAALRELIPIVGCRFGTLAAMVDSGLWPEATKAMPDLGDWLTDPLSPRGFGRIVEALLRAHKPDWTTWEQRIAALEDAHIADKRTIERWRSAQAHVPKVSNLTALAKLMGTGEEQRRATFLLQLGRVLAVARQDLAKMSDEMQAEAVQNGILTLATATREELKQPEVLAEFANAAQVPSDPLPLQLMFLVRPVALTAATVGVRRGIRGVESLLTMDPFDRVQAEWIRTAIFRGVANGELPTQVNAAGERAPARAPSDDLRQLAARLHEHALALSPAADSTPLTELDYLNFALMLSAESGDGVGSTLSTYSSAQQAMALPTAVEPTLADDLVRQHPHLMAERAVRLANAGETAASIAWFAAWRDSNGAKPWPERFAAAASMVRHAHAVIDRLRDVEDDVYALANDEGEDARDKLANGLLVLRRGAETATRLFKVAASVIPAAPGDLEHAKRLALLLPLALRLDRLDADNDGNAKADWVRTEPLAKSLTEELDKRPAHGELWALLALLQELRAEDHALSLKRTAHYGCGDFLAKTRALFDNDEVV